MFHMSFGGDEIFTMNMSYFSFKDLLLTPYDIHPQHFYFLVKMLHPIFGANYILYRIIPVFFSMLTVVAVYYIAKNIFNKKTALFITFIVSFSPILLFHSYLVRDYTLYTSSVILSFIFIEKWRNKQNFLNSVLAIFFIYLSLNFNYFSFFFFFVYTVYFFLISIRKNISLIFKAIYQLLIPLLILLIPYYKHLYYLYNFTTCSGTVGSVNLSDFIKSISAFYFHILVGTYFRGLPSFNYFISYINSLVTYDRILLFIHLIFYLLLLILFAFGVIKIILKKAYKNNETLLFAVLITVVPFLIIIFTKDRHVSGWYFPFMIPFIWVIIFYFIKNIKTTLLKKSLQVAILLFILLEIGLFLSFHCQSINKEICANINQSVKIEHLTNNVVILLDFKPGTYYLPPVLYRIPSSFDRVTTSTIFNYYLSVGKQTVSAIDFNEISSQQFFLILNLSFH